MLGEALYLGGFALGLALFLTLVRVHPFFVAPDSTEYDDDDAFDEAGVEDWEFRFLAFCVRRCTEPDEALAAIPEEIFTIGAVRSSCLGLVVS